MSRPTAVIRTVKGTAFVSGIHERVAITAATAIGSPWQRAWRQPKTIAIPAFAAGDIAMYLEARGYNVDAQAGLW